MVLVSSKRIFLEKKFLQYFPLILAVFTAFFTLIFFSIFFERPVQEDDHTQPFVNQRLVQGAVQDVFSLNEKKIHLPIHTGFFDSCFLQTQHLRPDDMREGCFLVMGKKIQFILFEQPFYCKSDGGQFVFSQGKEKIEVIISLEGTKVYASVYGLVDEKNTYTTEKQCSFEKILLEKSLLKERPLREDLLLNSFAKKVRRAKLYKPDALYEHYAGAVFKEKKGKLRLFVEKEMLFLPEGGAYTYDKGTFICEQNTKNKLLMTYKKETSGITLYLFSPCGKECYAIKKHFEPLELFADATFLQDLQILDGQIAKCKIFGKRLTVKKGDWFFLKKDRTIHPLRNFHEIQECISALTPGSLVIIDEIQQTNNTGFVIMGHFFDQTRQSSGVIRKVIEVSNRQKNKKNIDKIMTFKGFADAKSERE